MAANPQSAWTAWDDRYADLVLGKRNWQIAALAFAAIALVLACGIVWQASRSRIVPYVVQVDRLGQSIAIPEPLTPASLPVVTARMLRYELAAFIINARSVSADPAVTAQRLAALHAHARGTADAFLDQYLHANNPYVLARKQTVTVTVNAILQLAPASWQVRWTEAAFDTNGVSAGPPTAWEAVLKTAIDPPRSADALVDNPMGLHVVAMEWTQNAENQ